jgi:hypothetical protein
VLVVRDVVPPRRAAALVVDFEHRRVAHEAVRSGTVPVLLAGLEEDPVAGTYHFNITTPSLTEADAFGDPRSSGHSGGCATQFARPA